jgi:hypothetical protein
MSSRGKVSTMAAKNSAAAQEHAAKKRAQLERARQIKEARAAAAAAADGGDGGGSGGHAMANSHGSAMMDLSIRVASEQPMPIAPGERFTVESTGRPHIDAYAEYKHLVGAADNGTMFTPDE